MQYSKIKLDFQLVHNIYYRAGIFFIIITLLFNIIEKYDIIHYELKDLRLYTISIGLPLFVYGLYTHYKSTKDKSFIIQTIFGFFLGFVIIVIAILIK